MREVIYQHEMRTLPTLSGKIEMDETMFGGKAPGKRGWGAAGKRGNKVVITKDKSKPKGRDHINGIEGFWSYAKNWLYHYRGVPQKYFHFYLKEIEWRFNHRNENLVKLLRKLLSQRVVKEQS